MKKLILSAFLLIGCQAEQVATSEPVHNISCMVGSEIKEYVQYDCDTSHYGIHCRDEFNQTILICSDFIDEVTRREIR